MGLSYLWVDALCIIQDSTADKEIEISVMDHIFQNAEFTICAASAGGCMEGFLQKRNCSSDSLSMPEVEHSMLQIPCPDDELGTILVKRSQMHRLANEPLYTRGWTYQEQMLSPRVLVYDSWLVWWECLESVRTDEGNSNIINSRDAFTNALPLHGRMRRIEETSHNLKHDHDYLWKAWVQIVQDYTDRHLTFDSDRLPALSGLASRFSKLWGCAYYAGLWEKKLLEGLGWFLYQPSTSLVDESLAPSWSWASVIGAVGWGSSLHDDDLPLKEHPVNNTSIIECKVIPAEEAAPFGRVTEWSITIEGPAQWIDWDGQEQIEAKGLDPDSRPTKSMELGSPLYPDGIVARAKPDYSQLPEMCMASEGDPSAPMPDYENIFYLGVQEAEMNEGTIPILVVIITRWSALMVCRRDDGTYRRIGILEFRYETELKTYFEGCDVRKITIY
ncbi:MAG: hypothetical protein Q9195_008025 [Heterodermia aff. obscurata]